MKKISVSVSDPKIENEGRRDQFTTYLVSTEKTSVRRRYSDFQWLYARLQTELPGAIVPTIPHKMAMGKKFDPAFVEMRRRHLQNFMTAVVGHEEMQRAPSMTPFMLDKFGLEFDTGKKKVETNFPAFVELVDEEAPSTVQQVSNMLAKAGTMLWIKAGKKELIQTPAEKEIEAIQEYMTMLEGQIKTLVKSAETMAETTGQMATVIGDMTTPIVHWRSGYQQTIKISDEICEMMGALIEFTNDYSQLMRIKHRQEQIEFEDVMLRLGTDVKSIKTALKQRKQWQLAYTARMEQISSKEDQISKATFSLKPPEVTGKYSQERTDLMKMAQAEKSKLEESTTRFLKEFGKSQKRLELQLKEAFCHYAQIQIAYTSRINEAWGQLLPYVSDPEPQQQQEEPTEQNSEPSYCIPSEPGPPPSEPPPPPPEEDDIL